MPPIEPAQPEQPREGTRAEGLVPTESLREAIEQCREMEDPHRYHMLCAKIMSRISCATAPEEPAQPQPRGEGDDLASRLDERAELWERKGGLGASIAAGAYRQAAEMARASTPTEQGEGDDLAARLEEKARAESDEFGNYHDRYAEGPALPEPPRIESAPARVETEDIERLRDVVDRFDDGVGMNYLYVESLGRILDSLGDLTYKDLAEVDEIVIERGKTSGPEAFSWATPPKGGFDPRHDASRGPDRPASPSQPIEQANCPESTQKNLPAAPPDPQPSEARVDLAERLEPTGEGDDLAARLKQEAMQIRASRDGVFSDGMAEGLDRAASIARASTHPKQSGRALDPQLADALEALSGDWDGYPECARTNAQAVVDAYRNAASPTPTEQGEDRTRIEWHDGIEHGDELALRHLAATIGCGIPYGCQPSVGKRYAAALDRVLDRLLPLDPAPEQGEGEAS